MNKLRLDVNFTFQRKYISRASVVSISKNQIPTLLCFIGRQGRRSAQSPLLG